MKVDLEKIRIGKSLLTDNIYAGTVNKDNISWRNKVDITNDFMKAVIERFAGFRSKIRREDGVVYEITVREIKGKKNEKK